MPTQAATHLHLAGSGSAPAPALLAEVEDDILIHHSADKARALAVLTHGDPAIAGAAAFKALTKRNHELLSGGPDAIRSALADQVILLEAVVTNYTTAGARERNADRRKTLQNVALKASSTLAQTLLALHRVTEDSRNADAIVC
jgi:hypothetical protein